MCTLLLAWRAFDDAPVVVAANRDEATDRPSRPPAVREHRGTRFVAPLDERAGGTWIGYSEHGVVVALTNRWVDGDAEPGSDGADPEDARSRGRLVRDALAAPSADAAGRAVERGVRDDEYGGFNLVAANADAARCYEWDGTLRTTTFDPGVHVVVNVGVDGAFSIPADRREAGERQVRGARRARSTLQPQPGETVDEWRERARALLGDHDAGFCVHGEGFGTRSSSVIALRGDGDADYAFADGPPCETPHRPVDDQV